MGTNARTDGQIFTQYSGISSHSMGARILVYTYTGSAASLIGGVTISKAAYAIYKDKLTKTT